eukprot:PhF_6_TR41554/c0_g1_i3/m.62948
MPIGKRVAAPTTTTEAANDDLLFEDNQYIRIQCTLDNRITYCPQHLLVPSLPQTALHVPITSQALHTALTVLLSKNPREELLRLPSSQVSANVLGVCVLCNVRSTASLIDVARTHIAESLQQLLHNENESLSSSISLWSFFEQCVPFLEAARVHVPLQVLGNVISYYLKIALSNHNNNNPAVFLNTLVAHPSLSHVIALSFGIEDLSCMMIHVTVLWGAAHEESFPAVVSLLSVTTTTTMIETVLNDFREFGLLSEAYVAALLREVPRHCTRSVRGTLTTESQEQRFRMFFAMDSQQQQSQQTNKTQ